MTDAKEGLPRILHCHSELAGNSHWKRCVRLINAFGRNLEHSIVTAGAECSGAEAPFPAFITARFTPDFPSLRGKPWPGRLLRLARAMQPYDLVLTYGWDAMDAVMAHTLFSEALGLPPLVHHEDGNEPAEANGLKLGRNWYRRIGLGKAAGLVVPTERLERIALVDWQQPIGRVRRIAEGVDTAAFAQAPNPDSLRGIVKRDGEKWVGTFARNGSARLLVNLVGAVATLPEDWHCVIAGDRIKQDAIRAEADRLEISHRVHLLGEIGESARILGLFDIFMPVDPYGQDPRSFAKAMAAGLPIAAYSTGLAAEMVAAANRPYIVLTTDAGTIIHALQQLALDPAERVIVGDANRAKARAEYDEAGMIESYRRLYASALGREI